MKRAVLFRAGWAVCAVTFLCAAPRAPAEVHPAGDEFVVAATGDKLAASMDGLSRLVIAWRDRGADAILIRRFAPTGEPIGPITTVYEPWEPDADTQDVRLACGLDGSCAVPYVDRLYLDQPVPTGPDMSIWRYWLAVYDALGQCVRNAAGPFGETAAEASGAFAVTRLGPWAVMVSLYDAAGERLVPTVQLSAGLGAAAAPRIAADSSGRYLVAWTEHAGDGSLWHLAQRVTPAGEPLGTPFAIDPYDALCGDAAGRIVSVRIGTDAQGYAAVFASRFGVDGARVWGPVQVNQGRAASSPEARVACDASGAFVAAWRGVSADGTLAYVAARRYSAGNVADGAEFQANQAGASPGEIAVAADPRGNFTVLWRSGAIRARRFSVERPSVRQGDIDCDGQTDLVLARPLDGQVRVWTMSEAQRLANAPLHPSSPDPDWSVVGVDDFSGDGHNDLLLRHDDGALWLWVLGGEGGVECLGSMPLGGAAPFLPPEWDVAATGDFTLDGWPDVVWQERATGRVVVWTTANGAYAGARAPVPDRPADSNWRVVAAQDFDGDGKRDLLWFNTTSGRLVQWLLDAGLRRQAGRFTNPPQASDVNWQVVAAGDYGVGPGGQWGTNDVVWRNVFSGRLVVWFLDLAGNRTAGTFTNPAAPSDPLAWTVVGPH
jgi:hypothetical protein